jgi:hypothetical protein
MSGRRSRPPCAASSRPTRTRSTASFGDAQWTNKDRLPDACCATSSSTSRAQPGQCRHRKADILGQSYEYLIKKFADATNKKAGEFYTPRSVVRLMVNILDPREGESIYDPTCGTGGMLLEAIHHVRRRGAMSARSGASSTVRRRTSPPPPSPA